MSVVPEALLEQALTLPSADRAKLASGLLASLDDHRADAAEVERLWSEETERRAEQITPGNAQLTTWRHLNGRIEGLRSPSTDE